MTSLMKEVDIRPKDVIINWNYDIETPFENINIMVSE